MSQMDYPDDAPSFAPRKSDPDQQRLRDITQVVVRWEKGEIDHKAAMVQIRALLLR